MQQSNEQFIVLYLYILFNHMQLCMIIDTHIIVKSYNNVWYSIKLMSSNLTSAAFD